MIKRICLLTAISAALMSCGGGDGSASDGTNSAGFVEITGDAIVESTLTASITDSDGLDDSSVQYQWYADGVLIDGATSASYTVPVELAGSAISVLAVYIDGNGLRESHESAPTSPTINAGFISATFIYGLVDGASCEIFAVGSDGAASTEVLATTTSENGTVDFGARIPHEGSALISCSGGTYTDEATGDTLIAPTTRAVVELNGDGSFTVSPLTEIATLRAETEGDLGTALTTYNDQVAAVFGLPADSITSVTPTDLSTTAASDDEAGAYATAIALLSQLDANDPDRSAEDIVEDLADDLADDGLFSESTLNEVNTAQTDLASSAVADNLDDAVLQDIVDAINNAPEPATFEGLNATISNEAVEPLSGVITVIDPNPGEDTVVAQTDIVTTYGTFSITTEGEWTYTVDTGNSEVAALETGEAVNDTIAIQSADGTSASLVLRVAALTQVVRITDPGGDTGEIRFNLNEPLLVGKLSFSFLKEEAIGSDGNVKDAYVALYGAEDSNRETLIDLRIQGDQFEDDDITPIEPRFFARNTDADGYPGDIVTYPFTEDQWYDVEITWDVDAVGEEVTVIIDGDTVNGGPFQTAAIVGDDCGGASGYRTNCLPNGVENIQFRFGDNDRTIPFGSYFVDDILVYDNVAGTGTPVFEEDFENSTLGTPDSIYREETTVEIVTFDRAAESESTPAEFLNLTASINADDTAVLMDMVSVFDPDPGENLVVGQTDTVTTYGTFSILPAGMWEYTLDTTDATIAALMVGQNETDTVSISSVDGTTAEVVITIRGQVPLPASDVLNNVAVIRDLRGDFPGSDPAGADTGELRYNFEDEIAADDSVDTGYLAGRLEVQITRTDDDVADDAVVDPVDDPNGEFGQGSADAFINLFNSSTNDAGSLIKLRIKDDRFELDYHSSCDDGGSSCSDVVLVDGSDVNVPPSIDALLLNQFNTIVMTWEYTDPMVSDSPVINITIDGVDVLTDYTVLNDAPGGLTHLSFRFGDNDGWLDPRAKFTVDNWAIYSDTAGNVLVAEDDFQSYADGDSLDTDNAVSPYNSSTDNAVVEETAEGLDVAVGLGTSGNQFANVTDVAGTSSDAMDDAGGTQSVAVINADDTGELRIDLGSSDKIVTGRMTFQMYKGTEVNTGVDGFVLLGGVDTGTSESILDLRLDQSDNHYDIRGGMSAVGTYNTNTIYEVEISWDASSANTISVAPTVSISIDGVPLITDEPSGTNNLTEAADGVRYIQFRVADGDDITRADFRIDELVVYKTVDDVESEVFSDDFEAYAVGDSLDSDADTKAGFELMQTPSPLIPSEYNNNSFSVTVGEE